LVKKIIIDTQQISASRIQRRQEPSRLPFDITPPPLTPDEYRKLLLTKKVIEGSVNALKDQLSLLSVKLSTVESVSGAIDLINLVLQLKRTLVPTN